MPSTTRRQLRTLATVVALVASTSAVYMQALDHDFVSYDDAREVFENPKLQEPLTLATVARPFTEPFFFNWIPLTYLVPIIPFFIFWDGTVSCLRCYSQDELREMTADLTSDDYGWEIGAFDLPGAPFKGTYLIGSPTRQP